MKPLNGRHILGIIGGTELLGAERGMIQALFALQDAGASISVGVSGRVEEGGAVGSHCRDLGFDTFTIPFGSHFAKEWMLRNRLYRKAQIRRLFSNSKIFRREVRRRRPDVLIFGSTLTYAFLALALLRLKIPVIFRVGDAPITQSRFQMGLWKSLAHRSIAVVCISQFIRSEVEAHLTKGMRVEVITNIAPIRTNSLNLDDLETFRKKKRPSQGVYLGQITLQKGVPNLIDALIALDDPDMGCWILGGGPHSRELEEVLKTKVTSSSTKTLIEFEGYVPDPRPYLKVADWHIAPSNYEEPLGNVVQEAKAQGTPSIVTPKGGLPETLTPNRTGWILDGAGVKAIEKGLQKCRDNSKALNEADILKESAQFNDPGAFRSRWVNVLLSVLQP